MFEDGRNSEVSDNELIRSVGLSADILSVHNAEAPQEVSVAPELSEAERNKLAKSLLDIYTRAGDGYQFERVVTKAYELDGKTLLSIGDTFARRDYNHAGIKAYEETQQVEESVSSSQFEERDIGHDDSLALQMAGQLGLADDGSEKRSNQPSSAAHSGV